MKEYKASSVTVLQVHQRYKASSVIGIQLNLLAPHRGGIELHFVENKYVKKTAFTEGE